MPYKRIGKCVYKKNTKKKVGCSTSVPAAKKYIKKLHMVVKEDILNFKDFFLEAISIQQAKDYKMSRKYSNAYNLPHITSVFQNKDRLIYPFSLDIEKESNDLVQDESSSYNKISQLLATKGFNIHGIKDYINGVCYKQNDKNTYNIGRVLEKIGTPIEIKSKKGNLIKTTKELELFKNDSIRKINLEEMVIVISRHPYDIFGMSTGRSWTSCMNISTDIDADDDILNCHVPREVNNGSIIAYLVPKSEVTAAGKVGLKKPVSRILLRPLKNKNNEVAYSIGPMYGAHINQFHDEVKNWISKHFNSKIKTNSPFTYIKGSYQGDPAEIPNVDVSSFPPRMVESNYRRGCLALFERFRKSMQYYNIEPNKFSTFYNVEYQESTQAYKVYAQINYIPKFLTEADIRKILETDPIISQLKPYIYDLTTLKMYNNRPILSIYLTKDNDLQLYQKLLELVKKPFIKLNGYDVSE